MATFLKKLTLKAPGRFELKTQALDDLLSQLKPGQMALKMSKAPINPSDFYSSLNAYFDKKPLPCTLGFEGLGHIIAVAEDKDRELIGRWAVAHFFGSESGSFATHAIADKTKTLILRDKPETFSFPFLINPLTAIGLFSLVKTSKSPAFVQNGASTSVGKLLTLLNKISPAPFKNLSIIRSENHGKFLLELGANFVLDQTQGNFSKQLKAKAEEINALTAFDCLAGEHTGILFNALPNDSRLFVYGALSIKHCGFIDPQQLIFTGKEIKGFHVLRSFLGDKAVESAREELEGLFENWKGDFEPKIFELEDYASAFEYFRTKKEKVLFNLS